MDVLTEYANDLLAAGATATIIAGYQAYLRILAHRKASAVLSSVAAAARSAWAETIMSEPDNGLLAVQTLRNTTMAATFLASTAVLLMVGVLTLSGEGPALKQTWHALNIAGTLRPELWLIKLLCMLLLLFFAFLNFANAIRVFNHVGYMINVHDPGGVRRFPHTLVAGELNRGGRYFSLGMRAYYYLIPLVCWLFGPLYMVGAAAVLVTVLLPRVDKIPKL